MDKQKEYIAEIHLGIETDTLDLTGNIVKTANIPRLFEEQIKIALTEFIGDIDPRISIGAEFFPERFLPLRIGIAGGGMDGFYAGAGLGLKMGPIHINLGVSQSG